MPTPVSHAAVGFAVGAWGYQPPLRRLSIIAAACAALPDIDYLGWPLAHRGLTHSIAFALFVALVATAMLSRRPAWTSSRTRVALVLSLALLSHGLLDGFTSYSVGVQYFAPFSAERFRFWWTPLGDSQSRLGRQFLQEAVVVLLPAIIAGWLAFTFRRQDNVITRSANPRANSPS